jgi:creatine kinase
MLRNTCRAALNVGGRTAKHYKGARFGSTSGPTGAANEKAAKAVPMELIIGSGLGLICGFGLRGALQKDVEAFAGKKKAAAPAKTLSADEKADIAKFEAWVAKQKAASGPDPKDTDDFKYITFTEMPPFHKGHKSLMRKIMTPELFERYKNVKSSKGFTFSNAIQCGVLKPHLGVGFTAGDEECFELFKDMIYPIVKGWHKFDPYTQIHNSDLNPLNVTFTRAQQVKFDQYVQSTRIRAARNISGFALPCGATPSERKGVEDVLKQAFGMFEGELKGTYYPLGGMSAADEDMLQSNGFLFQKPGPAQLLAVAGAARHWPDNRGIFHNDNKTALAWCNEEDHCRIISMQKGGDVWSVFSRFCQISDTIGNAAKANGAKLMEHPKLGFLGTCPSNLGTGLRASVMIKLPELNKDPHTLEEICDAFDLQPRGSSGEHSAAVGAKWDISNKQRIGLSEVQLVQKMIDGVSKIIQIEEMLAGNPGMKPMEALAKCK